MRVLTVDPGITTGWALWEDGVLLQIGELRLFSPPLLDLVGAVVIERLSIGPRMKREAFWADGIVRFCASCAQIPVIEQPPAVRQGPRRRYPLREIPSQHMRDAIWHGVAYYERGDPTWKFTLPSSSLIELVASTGGSPTESD